MTIRQEFTEAAKRRAKEAATDAQGNVRCQDPLCGVSEEWKALGLKLSLIVGFDFPWNRAPASEKFLIALRDAIMAARFKHRALKPIIKKFKLDGGALLEVDHDTECADGGAATADNAIVRCVFCHSFKTQARGNSRRRAPKKAAPEQLNVIKTAKVEALRAQVDKVRIKPKSLKDARVVAVLEGVVNSELSRMNLVRRHYTDEQVAAAARAREAACNDGFFGA